MIIGFIDGVYLSIFLPIVYQLVNFDSRLVNQAVGYFYTIISPCIINGIAMVNKSIKINNDYNFFIDILYLGATLNVISAIILFIFIHIIDLIKLKYQQRRNDDNN
jgi:hypothetical protein